jgi:predicted nucleic acid-binding protein
MNLESLVDEIDLIELDAHVAAIAGDVADAYGLRANDAIHLASALSRPRVRLIMMSWDARLRAAAARTGLALAPS